MNGIMIFLQDMKAGVRTDLASINSKLNDMSSSIKLLRSENESLRDENKVMRQEKNKLTSAVDRIEGQSWRNSLRFPGSFTEMWVETKVRSFIKDTLSMPQHELGVFSTGSYTERVHVHGRILTKRMIEALKHEKMVNMLGCYTIN